MPGFDILSLRRGFLSGGVEGENVSITCKGLVIRCCHVHVSSAAAIHALYADAPCVLLWVLGFFMDIPYILGTTISGAYGLRGTSPCPSAGAVVVGYFWDGWLMWGQGLRGCCHVV